VIAISLIIMMFLGFLCSIAGFMDAAVLAKVDTGGSLWDKAGQSPEDQRRDRKAVLAVLLDDKNKGPGTLAFGGLATAGLSLVAIVVLAILGVR
jgi:hypothetical protein